jgi:hypothetical protein
MAWAPFSVPFAARVAGGAAPLPMRASDRRLEAEKPPQFAVDLLEKTLFRLKWAVKGALSARRLRRSRPLTAHFNRKRVFSKRSTANCGSRVVRCCGEIV